MTARPRNLPRVLPALFGWAALAAVALPAGNPLRAVVVGAFLLTGPGAAAVAWARPDPSWRDRGPGLVSAASLAVVVSLALTALTAQALFFTHSFTAGRAVLALAGLTTLLTLLPRRLRAVPALASGRPVRPAREETDRPVSSAGDSPAGGSPAGGSAAEGPAAEGSGGDGPAAEGPGGDAPTGPVPGSGEADRHHRHQRHPRRSVRRPARWRLPASVGALLLVAACGTANGIANGAAALHPTTAATNPNPGLNPSDPLPPVGADQPPPTGPWHEVFRDDFNRATLDGSKWTTCYDWNVGGCTNSGHQEDQWYLPGQVSQANGALTLTAQREPTVGSDGRVYPWTSGMISTGRDNWDGTPRHTFTYGYFAAAIRTTDQPLGMFPAFWLLPANTRGGLPELDTAEFINSNQYVDLNLHAEAPDGTDINAHYSHGPVDFAVGYHVFGLDWEPDAVTWYVDGVKVFQVTDPAAIPSTPMELILNLAVGYQQPPPRSVDTTQVKVDWVAVWQH
ncbi:family 16 glycosylhydrolase [Kitasatospora sp. NPDC097691]|uniref:glycoside hydrolase family 16 protein n=1 Tax=Kitasatospora sp. NPDC097691 TaxID=3157231 RepID=UPI0033345BB7